jgi:hypothetical protein
MSAKRVALLALACLCVSIGLLAVEIIAWQQVGAITIQS